MTRPLKSSVVAATVWMGVAMAYAYPFGPPPSETGAFAVAGRPAEAVCVVCHTGNPMNDPSGGLSLLDLPAAYQPGHAYTFRLRLAHAWTPAPIEPRWGFQIQAVLAQSGDSAGVWQVTAPDSYQVLPTSAQLPQFKARRYLEHTENGIHSGQPGPVVEWAVHWLAPPADSGLVYFFAAGNSANGDNRSSGDFIFTMVESLPCAASVGVPQSASSRDGPWLAAPFPNPTRRGTRIHFGLPREDRVDLGVYDAQGRRIRVLSRANHPSGTHSVSWDGARDDGTPVTSGAYFVRLRAGQTSGVQSRVVTVLR